MSSKSGCVGCPAKLPVSSKRDAVGHDKRTHPQDLVQHLLREPACSGIACDFTILVHGLQDVMCSARAD